MARFDVLLVALAVTAPSLWAALVDRTMPLDTALERLLIAVVVTAVVLGMVRRLFADFAQTTARSQLAERLEAKREAVQNEAAAAAAAAQADQAENDADVTGRRPSATTGRG